MKKIIVEWDDCPDDLIHTLVSVVIGDSQKPDSMKKSSIYTFKEIDKSFVVYKTKKGTIVVKQAR